MITFIETGPSPVGQHSKVEIACRGKSENNANRTSLQLDVMHEQTSVKCAKKNKTDIALRLHSLIQLIRSFVRFQNENTFRIYIQKISCLLINSDIMNLHAYKYKFNFAQNQKKKTSWDRENKGKEKKKLANDDDDGERKPRREREKKHKKHSCYTENET